MEEFIKIEKADITGWKVTTKEGEVIYIGEYSTHAGPFCNEGVTYKDRKSFESGEGICYIPESFFEESEKYSNFTDMALNASEISNNKYQTDSGYTRQDIIDICNGSTIWAEDVFEHSDWACIETRAEEDMIDSEENNNWIEGALAYEKIYVPNFINDIYHKGQEPVGYSEFISNDWDDEYCRNYYIDELVKKGIITAERAEEIKYTEEY